MTDTHTDDMQTGAPAAPAAGTAPAGTPAPATRPPRGPLQATLGLFGSFGLAVVILIFLFLLTWLGTLQQNYEDIYTVQKRYFDQPFVVHEFRDIVVPVLDTTLKVPLPGGALLLVLLFFNLLVGGLIRLRRDVTRIGILITHVGIALLLIAGFIEFAKKDDGYIALFKGEKTAHFESFYEWEVAISEELEDGQIREHLIHETEFDDLYGRDKRVFRHPDLDVDVELSGYARNSKVLRAGAGPHGTRAVGGYTIQPLKKQTDSEHDRPGVYIALVPKSGGARVETALWGAGNDRTTIQRAMWVSEVGGKRYGVELRRQRWQLPFAVQLEGGKEEKHPGTEMARSYESDVLVIDGDNVQPAKIWMNNPLRRDGFTLYQTRFFESPGGPTWSVLATVRNPTDQWPKWACYIIALGLLIHFSMRLFRYVRSEARRPA